MTTQGIEELWQEYNERGEAVPYGAITKQQARAGVLHGASHIWIWRGHGPETEILLQQRAKDKLTWPGFFDISAAGHIDAGELPLHAAVRETKEELGVDIDPKQLRLLFVYRANDTLDNGVIENEFLFVYGLRLDSEVTFVHDGEEVDSILWMKLPEFQKLFVGKLPDMRMVPHGDVYLAELLRGITREHP